MGRILKDQDHNNYYIETDWRFGAPGQVEPATYRHKKTGRRAWYYYQYFRGSPH